MTDVDPVPAYFSFRYVVWLGWSNALTIICTLQLIFAQLTMPDPNMPISARPWIHWVWSAGNVLGIIAAQIKRNTPPPPPPSKPASGSG